MTTPTLVSNMDKPALLADLERRSLVALDVADAAHVAGDTAKERRAWTRYFLRLEQYAYTAERPDTAWCNLCAGEPPGASENEAYCLEHFGPVLEDRADKRAAEQMGAAWTATPRAPGGVG